MLHQFYHKHLETQLIRAKLLILQLFISMIQAEKEVRLEKIARVFPALITGEGLRHVNKLIKTSL
jgi:hypothetical protein